jgi:hypothetical protein
VLFSRQPGKFLENGVRRIDLANTGLHVPEPTQGSSAAQHLSGKPVSEDRVRCLCFAKTPSGDQVVDSHEMDLMRYFMRGPYRLTRISCASCSPAFRTSTSGSSVPKGSSLIPFSTASRPTTLRLTLLYEPPLQETERHADSWVKSG